MRTPVTEGQRQSPCDGCTCSAKENGFSPCDSGCGSSISPPSSLCLSQRSSAPKSLGAEDLSSRYITSLAGRAIHAAGLICYQGLRHRKFLLSFVY
ncbi:hypothetical protein IE4803_CH00173 [Rhizobium etli bv. phaseoli str. IE4803]|nr:hypothetical protein IE4803_CH00173 [Rhizobium etli bv. phaseoli str. IE4803]